MVASTVYFGNTGILLSNKTATVTAKAFHFLGGKNTLHILLPPCFKSPARCTVISDAHRTSLVLMAALPLFSRQK